MIIIILLNNSAHIITLKEAYVCILSTISFLFEATENIMNHDSDS